MPHIALLLAYVEGTVGDRTESADGTRSSDEGSAKAVERHILGVDI